MANRSYGVPSLEYITGFFDGEGCVSISRASNGTPRLMVLFTNNDHELLEAIQEQWGGAIYKLASNRGPLTERRQTYTLYFNRAAEQARFLRALEPALRIKRQQALNALDFLEAKSAIRGRSMPDWVRERLEACHLRAKMLSSRNHDNLPPIELPEEPDEYEQTEMEALENVVLS